MRLVQPTECATSASLVRSCRDRATHLTKPAQTTTPVAICPTATPDRIFQRQVLAQLVVRLSPSIASVKRVHGLTRSGTSSKSSRQTTIALSLSNVARHCTCSKSSRLLASVGQPRSDSLDDKASWDFGIALRNVCRFQGNGR